VVELLAVVILVEHIMDLKEALLLFQDQVYLLYLVLVVDMVVLETQMMVAQVAQAVEVQVVLHLLVEQEQAEKELQVEMLQVVLWVEIAIEAVEAVEKAQPELIQQQQITQRMELVEMELQVV
jgi:hypothetical protein